MGWLWATVSGFAQEIPVQAEASAATESWLRVVAAMVMVLGTIGVGVVVVVAVGPLRRAVGKAVGWVVGKARRDVERWLRDIVGDEVTQKLTKPNGGTSYADQMIRLEDGIGQLQADHVDVHEMMAGISSTVAGNTGRLTSIEEHLRRGRRG